MDIGRVIHQIAQPYNVLLLQNLGLDAAVEMCIRDRGNMEAESGITPGKWEVPEEDSKGFGLVQWTPATKFIDELKPCLLYTSIKVAILKSMFMN